jgi:predicted nucleic acid-binding Zn ribbon protein
MAEPNMVCRQCGTLNPPGNNFCGQCGTFIAQRPTTATPPFLLPAASAEEARNRRNSQIVYAITALFLLSCIVLSIVVIVWRP